MHSDIQSLPIASFLPAILASKAQVLILSAETGSGKTIGFPYALAEIGRTALCLEPLIATCEGSAEYVASLFGERIGAKIGLRAGENKTPGKLVTYATTAIGLVRAALDERRLRLDYLIIDEFHERRADQDVVFAWALQRLASGSAQFGQLVLASATLDVPAVERHIRSLGLTVQTFTVPGRTFPVTYKECSSVLEGISSALAEGADVLAFEPGVAEIEATCVTIRKNFPHVRVFPYHSKLSSPQRAEALSAGARGCKTPFVIVSTNALETGRTVLPRSGGSLHIVDSGLERQITVSYGVEGLSLQPISKAQQRQRGGRTGRISAGVCWQVDDISSARRAEYPTPEIRRTLLARLVLTVAAAGLDLASLPLFDAPAASELQTARDYLRSLKAISDDGKITKHGRDLISWPLDPRWAQVLQRSLELGCLADAILPVALAEAGGVDGRETPAPAQGEDWLSWQIRLFRNNQGMGGAIASVRRTMMAIRQAIPGSVRLSHEKTAGMTGLTGVKRAWASAHPDAYGIVQEGSIKFGRSIRNVSVGRPFSLAFEAGRMCVYTSRVISAPRGAFTVRDRVVLLTAEEAAEAAPLRSESRMTLNWQGDVVLRTSQSWGDIEISAQEELVTTPCAESTALLIQGWKGIWELAGGILNTLQERLRAYNSIGLQAPERAPNAETLENAVTKAIESALAGVTSYRSVKASALLEQITAELDFPTIPAIPLAASEQDVIPFRGKFLYKIKLKEGWQERILGSESLEDARSHIAKVLVIQGIQGAWEALYGQIQRVQYDLPGGSNLSLDMCYAERTLENLQIFRERFQGLQKAEEARQELLRGADARIVEVIKAVCPVCPCCGREWVGWEAFPGSGELNHPEGDCELGRWPNYPDPNRDPWVIAVGWGKRGRDVGFQPNRWITVGDTIVAHVSEVAGRLGVYLAGRNTGDSEIPYKTAQGEGRFHIRSGCVPPKWLRVTMRTRKDEQCEQSFGEDAASSSSRGYLFGRTHEKPPRPAQYAIPAGMDLQPGEYEYPETGVYGDIEAVILRMRPYVGPVAEKRMEPVKATTPAPAPVPTQKASAEGLAALAGKFGRKR